MRERRKNMFIADGWKDYRVLDTGGGMKLESWAGITLARRTPGNLGKAEARALEEGGGLLCPQPYRRRPLGFFQGAARTMDGFLWGSLLLCPPHGIQAYRPISRAVGKLGLYGGEDPPGGERTPGSQSVCLHRRGYAGLRGGWSERNPCGRGQEHGGMGQGKRRPFRPFRPADPVYRGRLHEIRPAGTAPGPDV